MDDTELNGVKCGRQHNRVPLTVAVDGSGAMKNRCAAATADGLLFSARESELCETKRRAGHMGGRRETVHPAQTLADLPQ